MAHEKTCSEMAPERQDPEIACLLSIAATTATLVSPFIAHWISVRQDRDDRSKERRSKVRKKNLLSELRRLDKELRQLQELCKESAHLLDRFESYTHELAHVRIFAAVTGRIDVREEVA